MAKRCLTRRRSRHSVVARTTPLSGHRPQPPRSWPEPVTPFGNPSCTPRSNRHQPLNQHPAVLRTEYIVIRNRGYGLLNSSGGAPTFWAFGALKRPESPQLRRWSANLWRWRPPNSRFLARASRAGPRVASEGDERHMAPGPCEIGMCTARALPKPETALVVGHGAGARHKRP